MRAAVAGPVRAANVRNNAWAQRGRRERWAPARDSAWALLERWVAPGARVAVVGAGNGDDVPLARLAQRAGRLDLIDLDAVALRRARRRVPRGARRRVVLVEEDVTGGAADRIVAGAAAHAGPGATVAPAGALGAGDYDVVVGDLLYSQLLHPALRLAGVPEARRRAQIGRHGQALTDSVVARLHRSAPGGVVVHLHDVACWSAEHAQPLRLDAVLAPAALAQRLALAERLTHAARCDPRASLRALGLPETETALWRWPFAETAEYLVRATVSAAHGPLAVSDPPGG